MDQKMAKNNKRTNPLLMVFLFALICVIITALIVFLLGYRYTSTDEGIKFFGKYKNGLPYNGTVYYPNGLRAELDYEKSTITYNNGDIYEGEITGILRNGKGKMTYYSTGESYVGPFVNDKITGIGVYYFSNNTVYSGSLVDNKKEGYGEITYSDGSTYKGNFSNDMMNGYGVYVWADGSKYEGSFINNIKNGVGKYTFASGEIYNGNWENDMRSGYGEFTWTNNEMYKGEFVNGQMHGNGTYSWPDGRVYSGYFENGKIIVKED